MGGNTSALSNSEEDIVGTRSYSSTEDKISQKDICGQQYINGNSQLQTNIVLPNNYIEMPNSKDSTTDSTKNGTVNIGFNGNLKNEDTDVREIKTTKIRFWILGMFSAFALLQNVVWGPFGPIFASSKYAFGWDDSIIAVFQSFGPAGTLLLMVPITWFDEKFGLRKGLLLTSSFLFVGTGLRCIDTSYTAYTSLAMIGGLLTGFAGCNCLAMPAMISARWFPPEERTTATAIGSFAAQIGLAGMYLSPLLVRSPPNELSSKSTTSLEAPIYYNSTFDSNSTNNSISNYLSKEDIKGDIMELMYIEFGLCIVLFLCILIYFPEHPKHPPSTSSKVERVNYFASIKKTIRNRDYIIVLLVYSFSFGVPVNWTSVMNFSFQCININQNQAMWVGVAACLAQAVSAFIVARITDVLYGYMKITIICLLLASSVFFLWFVLLIMEVITPSYIQVFIAIVGGYTLEYASVPILIELGVELAYPCSEAVVGSSFGAGFNLLSTLFLLFFAIPTNCYYWAGFVMLFCIFIPIIPLYFVKETHKRSSVDRKD